MRGRFTTTGKRLLPLFLGILLSCSCARSEGGLPKDNDAMAGIPTAPVYKNRQALVKDIFKAVGEEAGCQVHAFSQVINAMNMEEELGTGVQGANPGICWGLSALWLSERSQGTSDAEYLQKVGDWKNNPTYNKAQMLWKNQLDYEKLGFFPHFLGLDVARRPDGSEKQKQASFKKDLQFSADLKHRKENEFHDQTDPRGLVEWLKLKKPRYFMISVERADHAVAAAYDKQGLSFFDPNGGIMTCNAEAMTKALYWYFAHPKLHEVYAAKLGLKPGQTTLLATKYKKGKKALGSYGKAISAGTEAAGAIAGGNPQVALPEVTTTPTNLEGGAALRGN